jgi:hypothetical protein
MNEKDKMLQKWSPILSSLGVTGSQLDKLSQISENQSRTILTDYIVENENTSDEFPSLLPLVMKA